MARYRREFQSCCHCRARLVYMGQFRRKRLEIKNLFKKSKKESWQNFMQNATKENAFCFPYKLAADKVLKKEVLTSLKQVQHYTTSGVQIMEHHWLDTLVPPNNNENETPYHRETRQNNEAQKCGDSQVKDNKKGGATSSNPSSYRPISLLPVVGKVYERVIKKSWLTILKKTTC